jgi:hypothetical protein
MRTCAGLERKFPVTSVEQHLGPFLANNHRSHHRKFTSAPKGRTDIYLRPQIRGHTSWQLPQPDRIGSAELPDISLNGIMKVFEQNYFFS